MELNNIYLGDCLEVMKNIPDKDHLLKSPMNYIGGKFNNCNYHLREKSNTLEVLITNY